MYILYIALLINLGPFPGSFVGHTERTFSTIEQCNEMALSIHNKVEKKLGSLIIKYEDRCIKIDKGKSDL